MQHLANLLHDEHRRCRIHEGEARLTKKKRLHFNRLTVFVEISQQFCF